MILLVDGGELAVLEVCLHPVVDPGKQLGLVLAHADRQPVGLHGDLGLDRARRVLLADRGQERARRRQGVRVPRGPPPPSRVGVMVTLGSTVRAGFSLLIAGRSERAVARTSACPEATATAMVAS